MADYRIPYYEIPWHILLGALIVKTWYSLFVKPCKWLKEAKYYRKRRRIVHAVGWPLVAFVSWLVFSFGCQVTLGKSSLDVVLDLIKYLITG